MKINLIHALFILFFTCFSFQKVDAQSESERPFNLEEVIHPDFIKWEKYFEDNFLSKGVTIEELGEGSGYLPYWRARKFYEQRANHQGEITQNRWELWKQSKQHALNRGGENMVANWQNLGPNTMQNFGGRMITHAFDPNDINVVWAGSASGGLWKTEDGAESWQPKSDQIPSTGIGAIALNPANTNSMLIGTGEGYWVSNAIRPGIGAFKSYDGGETWNETSFSFAQSQGVSAFKIVWDYSDTTRVYMAATNGIWLSEDGGENWSVKMAGVIGDDLLQDPENPEILYAAIESNGIYKSTDSGENWDILSNGLPIGNSINFIHLAMCDSLPQILYASITDAVTLGLEGLYKTEDGGDSWTKIQNAPNAFCTPPALGFPACQGHYDNAVAVAPNDPNRIIFGGITFWASTDGGLSWQQNDRYTCLTCIDPPPGKTWVDQHDIGFSPHDPNLVYVFNDGGVAKSTDGGLFWTLKNSGLETAQFYAIASAMSDTTVLIGGMQDHGLQGTDSNYPNRAWRVWGFLDGTDVEIDPNNEDIFYGVWADGQYLKTNTGVTPYDTYFINSGINPSENIFFYFNPLRLNAQNPQELYTATSQRIYKSTNGGNFWSPIASIPNVRVLEIDKTNPDFVYAASYSNQGTWAFWRSENAGEDWFLTDNYPGWRVTDIKSDPNNEGVLFATRNSAFVNNPHVLKSTDFGDTWVDITNNLPDITTHAITINTYDSECLYLATDLGVYLSTNGGEEWVEYNQGMPVSFVYDIHYHPADTTLRIGTYGRGAWKTKSYPLNYPTNTAETAAAIMMQVDQPFPSPTSDLIFLDYELPESADVEVNIFNNIGQMVQTVLQEKQTAGQHQVSWDLKNVVGAKSPAGIYYFWIKVRDRAVVRKFVVQ